MLDRFEQSPELARLRSGADGRVDPGYLFELIPANGIVDNVDLPEEALLDAGLSEEELADLAQSQIEMRANSNGGLTSQVRRLASVAAYTRKRAKGRREECDELGFPTENVKSYLESHHIRWLAQGREDLPRNTAALCPGCHCEAHSGRRDRRVELARKLLEVRARMP